MIQFANANALSSEDHRGQGQVTLGGPPPAQKRSRIGCLDDDDSWIIILWSCLVFKKFYKNF